MSQYDDMISEWEVFDSFDGAQHDDMNPQWEVFDSFDGAYDPNRDDISGEAETNKAVLIKLKNPGAVARGQGAVASFAQSVAPATTESEVYDGLAAQIQDSLKAKNIEADVSVVEPRMWKIAANGPVVGADLGFIVGGAGIVGLLAWALSKRKKR